jgi:hypothetical protein
MALLSSHDSQVLELMNNEIKLIKESAGAWTSSMAEARFNS